MVNTSKKQFTTVNKYNSTSHKPGSGGSSASGGLAGTWGKKPEDREKARLAAFNKHFTDKAATGNLQIKVIGPGAANSR